MRPCLCQYWALNDITNWTTDYCSHVLIWDGSTRKLWTVKPARFDPESRFVEIATTVFVDTKPKVGQGFGFIAPDPQYDALLAQYQAAANPMEFMAAVSATFLAAGYPGTFQMAAMHIVGDLAFIYRMKTTSAAGLDSVKFGFSSSGMILQDIARDYFSESFKTS